MSGRVMIGVDVDTSAGMAKIDQLMQHANAEVASWNTIRQQVLRDVRVGFTLVSQLVSSARMAMSLMADIVDPFFSSLIGMVMSTVSMMLSVSSAMSVTVLGAPIGLMIASIAVGLNILSIAKLVGEQAKITNNFETLRNDLSSLYQNVTLTKAGGL